MIPATSCRCARICGSRRAVSALHQARPALCCHAGKQTGRHHVCQQKWPQALRTPFQIPLFAGLRDQLLSSLCWLPCCQSTSGCVEGLLGGGCTRGIHRGSVRKVSASLALGSCKPPGQAPALTGGGRRIEHFRQERQQTLLRSSAEEQPEADDR